MLCGMWDLSSLTRDQTRAPCNWKRGVLTTGLPGSPDDLINLNDLFKDKKYGRLKFIA